MNNPLVTIAISVYNGRLYVERMVRSCLAQTLQDIEILCVDDGSVDGSAELLDRLGAEDPRIRIVHKPNGGLPSARNACLDSARGKYLFLCDQDDFLHPQAMEFAVRTLAENNADYVSLHCWVASDDKTLRMCGNLDFDAIPRCVCKSRYCALNSRSDFPLSLETWSFVATTELQRSVRFIEAHTFIEGGRNLKVILAAQQIVCTQGAVYGYFNAAADSITHYNVKPKLIADFSGALLDIAERYAPGGTSPLDADAWVYIRKWFVIRNLKYQLNYLRRNRQRSDVQTYRQALELFGKELRMFQRYGCISPFVCNLRHYVSYLKIIFWTRRQRHLRSAEK